MPSPSERVSLLPQSARRQLRRLTTACQAHFGQRLLGLYLHGSAATGGWQAQASDLDLVAVLSAWQAPDRPVLSELCLQLSRHPVDLELHVVTQRDLWPWQHPAPYRFHYSEAWRLRIEEGILAPGTDRDGGARDRDLAAHLTTLRQGGVTLSGRPAAATVPVVPRLHYLDAVMADLAWAAAELPHEGYEVLNLCRTWSFLTDGHLRSKEDGGRWAVPRLPAAEAATVYQALLAHRGLGPEDPARVAPCRQYIWPMLWQLGRPAERAVIRRWWPEAVAAAPFR